MALHLLRSRSLLCWWIRVTLKGLRKDLAYGIKCISLENVIIYNDFFTHEGGLGADATRQLNPIYESSIIRGKTGRYFI